MPFSIRSHRRFPLQRSVTYHAEPFQDQGTIWNLSCTGWRLSGDLPMRPGKSLSLTVTLPNEQHILIPGVVVWCQTDRNLQWRILQLSRYARLTSALRRTVDAGIFRAGHFDFHNMTF